jgi:hypothetical protein
VEGFGVGGGASVLDGGEEGATESNGERVEFVSLKQLESVATGADSELDAARDVELSERAVRDGGEGAEASRESQRDFDGPICRISLASDRDLLAWCDNLEVGCGQRRDANGASKVENGSAS